MRINDFIAELPGGGARSNLYRVLMPFPATTIVGGETRKLSFLCKAAQLPSSELGTIEVPYQGRKAKLPGDRVFTEPFTVTVINDNDFLIRNAFERWSNLISNHTENVGSAEFNNYVVDATVEQLDRDGEAVKVYNVVGAWPSLVSAIELGYENENQIEEYTVELQYQFWTSDTTS